jgi:hypothetical protein
MAAVLRSHPGDRTASECSSRIARWFGATRYGVSFPISGPVVLEIVRKVVGVAGFEPATPTSRTWCATRLRYTPTEGRTYSRATAGPQAGNH